MEKPYILVREDMKKDIADTVNKYIGKVYIADIMDYLSKLASNMQEATNAELKSIQEKYEAESGANETVGTEVAAS
jgi:hypothetical protein